MAHHPGDVLKPLVKLPRDPAKCWQWLGKVADNGYAIKQWHNKPCPACGEANIITDQDMAVWTAMRELVGVVNAVAGDIPDDHDEGSIAFSFDTAGLRSNT